MAARRTAVDEDLARFQLQCDQKVQQIDNWQGGAKMAPFQELAVQDVKLERVV